jgi:hypothetical protein
MSAPSAAKVAANQANAQFSTGPTSPDGKQRSSLNATRHGLTGRVVVLPSEDMTVYQAFSRELLASLDPKTPLERELAQTVVDQQWRLNRVRTIEDSMLAVADSESPTGPDHPAVDSALAAGQAFLENSKAFVNLTIYEQRIHRIMEKALAQLKQLQTERKALEQAQMEEALKLRILHQEEGLPYDPQADGFVFSSEQLEREAARREREARLKAARVARLSKQFFAGKPNGVHA